MIQTQTKIKVSDNTGVRSIVCIRVLSKRWAQIRDIFIRVVRESWPNMFIQRSEVVRAVLVRTKKETQRNNGSRIWFDNNEAIIINKDGNPRGSRIFGPIARELRHQKLIKILSLAPEIILYFL
jgi:large subunit ribosomal protein L14